MPKVVCVWRGSDEFDNAVEHLDESKVQLLYSKFPVGTGTFKRNKFIYVQFVGPKCDIMKRGQGLSVITAFTTKNIRGVPGFSTTDKAALSFESLVKQMRYTFVTDNGTFSMEQIREEYRERLAEEQKMMHKEREQAAVSAAMGRRARRHTLPMVKVVPKPPNPQPLNEERPLAMMNAAEQTNRVMTSLRQANGSVNWAIFTSDAVQLTVHAYGSQGIFEMVKNLPDDSWLFGLFRITFSNGQKCQRRMIFFQWIGSQLRAVRGASQVGVYPAMARALSPFDYEIYLVGRQDLNPQAIINKSKSAFRTPADKRNGQSREFIIDSIVFTEENYRRSMVDEQSKAESLNDSVKKPSKVSVSAPVLAESMDQSMVSMGSQFMTLNEPAEQDFDVDETIELVQKKEGGLVWAIFEVQ